MQGPTLPLPFLYQGQDVQGPDLASGEVVKYSVITMQSGKLQATNLVRVGPVAFGLGMSGGVKRKADGPLGATDTKRSVGGGF